MDDISFILCGLFYQTADSLGVGSDVRANGKLTTGDSECAHCHVSDLLFAAILF
jgi:hypothetical protein